MSQGTRRRDGEKDKIHVSAQLTIKPNYLWIGLMAHMLASKFLDQEVAWEGALADVLECVCGGVCMFCVCVCERQVNVSVTKRLG